MFSNSLKVYVLGMAVGLVGYIVPGVIGSIIGIVSDVMLLYGLYQMRTEHRRLETAFTLNIASLIISLVMTVLGIITIATALKSVGAATIMGALTMILSLTTFIVVLVAKYNFYWGLDDLNSEKGYGYPAGQIKWCFYIAFIGGILGVCFFFSFGLQTLVTIAVNGAQIYWMYKYYQAVETQELR